MITEENGRLTISTDVLKDETELRQIVDLVSIRLLGGATTINGFSKDFIRETWNRVNWTEIFQHWYIRYKDNNLKTFKEFMKTIDKEEFYND